MLSTTGDTAESGGTAGVQCWRSPQGTRHDPESGPKPRIAIALRASAGRSKSVPAEHHRYQQSPDWRQGQFSDERRRPLWLGRAYRCDVAGHGGSCRSDTGAGLRPPAAADAGHRRGRPAARRAMGATDADAGRGAICAGARADGARAILSGARSDRTQRSDQAVQRPASLPVGAAWRASMRLWAGRRRWAARRSARNTTPINQPSTLQRLFGGAAAGAGIGGSFGGPVGAGVGALGGGLLGLL